MSTKQIMGDQYITVTSGKSDPCDFVSRFLEPINVKDGYEVAVIKILHGPIYNITEMNNKFSLIKVRHTVDYFVPPGYYETTTDLLAEIHNVLKIAMDDARSFQHIKTVPEFNYKESGEASYLKLKDDGISFLIDNKRDGELNVLQAFGYYVDTLTNRLDIIHHYLGTETKAGFLYSNIAANSVIDDSVSRLLCCFPMNTDKPGYSCFEFENPSYLPLRVNSFAELSFQINDTNDEKINIKHKETLFSNYSQLRYPTIITLHIRKIRL